MHVCMYMYISVCMYMHVCRYIYVPTYLHIHTNEHTIILHTYKLKHMIILSGSRFDVILHRGMVVDIDIDIYLKKSHMILSHFRGGS
jgi:hypothetical protein